MTVADTSGRLLFPVQYQHVYMLVWEPVCVRVHILKLVHSALHCGFPNQGDQSRSSCHLHVRSGRKDRPLWVSGLLLRS